MVGDFIICLLAFVNIFIYLFLFKKKRGTERGTKGGSRREGPRFVYTLKEGGISARKAALLWGLSMKKSTLQIRLNRRVTFDRRIEVPSPKKKSKSFAD